MAAQLFVGSLSRDTQERDLENVFFKHGKLLRCDLKRGFGFVEYDSPRDAEHLVFLLMHMFAKALQTAICLRPTPYPICRIHAPDAPCIPQHQSSERPVPCYAMISCPQQANQQTGTQPFPSTHSSIVDDKSCKEPVNCLHYHTPPITKPSHQLIHAIRAEHGRRLLGSRIVVEWAKGSIGDRGPRHRERSRSRDRDFGGRPPRRRSPPRGAFERDRSPPRLSNSFDYRDRRRSVSPRRNFRDERFERDRFGGGGGSRLERDRGFERRSERDRFTRRF